MRKFLTACFALVAVAYSTFAAAEFATFEKNKFESLVKSYSVVVVHTHEWW